MKYDVEIIGWCKTKRLISSNYELSYKLVIQLGNK